MASQNSPEAWEAYTTSFPLSNYQFTPTDPLLYHSQTWQSSDPSQSRPQIDEEDLSSGDEIDFDITTNQEQGGIAEDASEDIDEAHVEQVTPYGLPLPPTNFQPFRGENHSRSWRLPQGFGSSPRVSPPRGCTADRTCSHTGRGENCASTASDPGICIEDRWDLPLLIFELFFTTEVLDTMVSNTNKYAASKNAGIPHTGQQSRRPWKEISVPELKIWLGLIIYMSVVRLTRVDEYWTKNGEWPTHCIMKFQGFNWFANIKRFFHLSSPPDSRLPRTKFYEKLDPVALMVKTRFREIAIPATSVSIDEIIVRCTGRSKHIVMMRGKPSPVGYNVLALCEAGYCYSFLFSSPITGFFGLPSPIKQIEEAERRRHQRPDQIITSMITSLSKTSRAVLYLMMQLPDNLFFTLYCDNLFSNADLFHILKYYGISACGTARSGSKNWPQLFREKIKRKTTRLPFNFQTVQIVHGDICAVVWQDKNLVQFLTTHHDPQISTLVNRKKPSAHNGSKWYKDIVVSIWGNQGVASLPLPTYSVDYNYNMGGVDRHDQIRSYSPT